MEYVSLFLCCARSNNCLRDLMQQPKQNCNHAVCMLLCASPTCSPSDFQTKAIISSEVSTNAWRTDNSKMQLIHHYESCCAGPMTTATPWCSWAVPLLECSSKTWRSTWKS